MQHKPNRHESTSVLFLIVMCSKKWKQERQRLPWEQLSGHTKTQPWIGFTYFLKLGSLGSFIPNTCSHRLPLDPCFIERQKRPNSKRNKVNKWDHILQLTQASPYLKVNYKVSFPPTVIINYSTKERGGWGRRLDTYCLLIFITSFF